MSSEPEHVTLASLRGLKAAGRKFAMLTAYDYPTARIAAAAGVHSLLVGDSLGMVLLGHASTRETPLELMITLAEAVRRGAPRVYLIGDLPHEAMRNVETLRDASRRFRSQAGCDAVKLEVETQHVAWIERLAHDGHEVVAHLGLRPQSVLTPNDYRAQARDEASIQALVDAARSAVRAGAAMLLLEAVPPEASAAVVAEVDVPVVGCGAGPACDGHVIVTQDMLGLGAPRPPRFVPRHADLGQAIAAAMRRWVADIESGAYPAPEHTYRMRPVPSRPHA